MDTQNGHIWKEIQNLQAIMFGIHFNNYPVIWKILGLSPLACGRVSSFDTTLAEQNFNVVFTCLSI